MPTVSKKYKAGVIVGIVVGVGTASFLLVLVVFFVIQRRKSESNYDDEGKLKNDASYVH